MLPLKKETKDPLDIKFENVLLRDVEYLVEKGVVSYDLSREPAMNKTSRSEDNMITTGEGDLEIHNFIDEENAPYIVEEIDAKPYADEEENSDIEEQAKNHGKRVFIKQISEKKPEVNTKKHQSQDEGFIGIYSCTLCDKTYRNKSKYTNHIKRHAKDKPHECEICEKYFSTTSQLSRHMNSHTGNRPYKCQYCEASFGDPSTKIKHERTHTKERPYKCSQCNKTFTYSHVLKVHMMTHTGERPHICEYCGKNFSQLHHRKAHEKLHTSSKSVLYLPDIEFMEEDYDLKEHVIEEII